MHCVRSRLDLQVDDAAERPAEFGRVGAGLQFELVERVDAGEHDNGLQPGFVVVDTVQHVVVIAGPLAVGRERRGRTPRQTARPVDVRAGNAAHHARHRACQVDEIPAVERQHLDLLLCHRRAEFRRRCLHQRRRAGHGHRFFNRADFEPHIDPDVLIDAEVDVLNGNRLEPRQLRGDRVFASRQRRGGVLARGIGDDHACQPGVHVLERDSRARHDGAGGIGDRTEDGARHGLCGERCG